MPTRTQQADILLCAYASHGDTKHVLLFPEDPTRVLRVRGAGARPRRPPADAGVRDDRPRHRHEGLAVRAARVGRRASAYDRGKVMSCGRARGRQGLRPLPRRRRRRHPVPHLSRHAPDARRLFHARHDQGPLRALHRGGRRPTSTTCSGCCEVRDREEAGARSRCSTRRGKPARFGVIYFGSTSPAMDEALAALAAQRHPPRRAARARVSVPGRGRRLRRRARPRVRGRAEPRRAAARRCWSTNAASIRRS